VVAAPLMGTFYRAAQPGAPPFVERGMAVEATSVVGLIEVMKLMNSVYAGQDGQIADILVQDGDSVTRGQTLMRLASAALP
jgi:biotin carboxyl carrier protein